MGTLALRLVGLKKGEKLHEKLSYKNNFVKNKLS
jgi:FlaA1/EpsC-like NDP-sugar epimerase